MDTPGHTSAVRRGNNGLKVVLLLLTVSSAIGVVAYWRFIVSDKQLRADLQRMEDEGRHLSAEQCVDATMRWASHCSAMKSLCDATTPQMMSVCLRSGERGRHDYCARIGERYRDTHFGFAECRARGATERREKKICAMAYRAIAGHCARLRSGS